MHPPQLLVPFQLLRRTALAVHKIEDTSVLLVPSIVEHIQRYVDRLVHNILAAKTLAEVHAEPHRLNAMAGIHETAVKRVAQLIVDCHIFHDEPQLRTIEQVKHLVQAGVDCAVKIFRLYQMFDFQCEIAQNHRQREIFQVARSGMQLAPLAFRVVFLLQNDVERAAGNVVILIIACGKPQLPKRYRCECIRKDIIWINQRIARPVEREIPVETPVVTIFL